MVSPASEGKHQPTVHGGSKPGSQEAQPLQWGADVKWKNGPKEHCFISVPTLWPTATAQPSTRRVMGATRTGDGTHWAITFQEGHPRHNGLGREDTDDKPPGSRGRVRGRRLRRKTFAISRSARAKGGQGASGREPKSLGSPRKGLLMSCDPTGQPGKEVEWGRGKRGSHPSLFPLICQHLPASPTRGP